MIPRGAARLASAGLLTQALLVAVPSRAQVAPATVEPAGYVHEMWTITDGLPVNQVTAALQSRTGYLWLATFDGLVRFDGMRFTVYTTGTHPGLPSNRIVALHEGRDGAIWMVHEYNWVTRFHEGGFTSFGPEQGLRGSPTFAIHEDQEGAVWVGTDRDVVVYRGGRIVPLGPEPLNAQVLALHHDQRGVLWIGTRGRGLYTHHDGTLTHVQGLSRGDVQGFYETPDGLMWIASTRGVYRSRDGVLEIVSSAVSARQFVVSDDLTDLVIAANEGVFRYRDGQLENLQLDGWDPGFIVATARGPAGDAWLADGRRLYRGGELVLDGVGEVRALLFDHEGSLWIGARGLHRLKPALVRVYGAPEGGVDNVYPVHEDPDGTLWFGSFGGGLARFADSRFTRYSSLADGLPGALVTAIHRDADGDLWVGSYGGSFCRFRPGRLCQRPPGLGGENVRAIHRDRRGTLWVGADIGLFWLHDGAMQRPPGSAALEGRVVRAIHESADGTLWFGTNGAGLMRYRPDTGFAPFTTAQGLSSDLIRSIYEDARGVLWIGSEGRGLNRLELPPEGDLARARVTVYRQRDGLYEDVLHQILEDDFGRLWMSSNRGIFWVDRAELEAFARGEVERIHSTHYTERDGLRNREANGGVNSAGVKARDGRLWFATQAGVAVIDPARIRRNSVPPAVVIEEVAVAGTTQTIDGNRAVRLEAESRDFSINYTALSFLAPENVRFRYRLEGLDRDWVEAGNRRAAFYTNVPPGRYVFRVRGSNNDGVWNETGARLPLSVAPFLYETVWFRGLAILVLLGAVAGSIGFRVRGTRRRQRQLVSLVAERTRALQEAKEASEAARREAERHSRIAEEALQTVAAQTEQLQELDRAKSRFFANVSHEFRTPLTLMIGPLEDLRAGLHGAVPKEMDWEVVVALRNARRLLQLVEQLLDVARLEASRMEVRAQPGDLVTLLRNLLLAFSPVAERRRITVRLDEPVRPAVVYFDPDLMEKVFANLLSNAFKYTPEGGNVRLTVRVTVPVAGHPDFVEMPEGHVTVEVKDSGPGIPAADLPHVFERFYRAHGPDEAAGTGIGLSLARELSELHGGRIEVQSEEGFGATFTVTLPLGHGHFTVSQLADGDRAPDQGTGTPRGVTVESEHDLSLDAAAPVDSAEGDDRPTILVIDDNGELRRFVAKHLHHAGYRVVEAALGSDGLTAARELVPDCIISDIMMPGMDGHALCRALRGDQELDFVPVVLLTARAEREHRLEGLADGADDYITKPFDVDELVARVQNLIASRHRLRSRLRTRPALHPAPIDAVSGDDAFLGQVRDALETHLGDSEFSVDQLARAVGQSRSQLYRRLQELLGQTPSEALLQFRLERGADLLAARAGTVSEIAYGVGFKSVSHFCRRFRSRFGVTPSTYAATSPPAPTSPP